LGHLRAGGGGHLGEDLQGDLREDLNVATESTIPTS